ncbi:MAG TPA: hypothetical protein VFA45_19985 [Actinomycetes bacterium]|nr:hypothetical protein [Actinomycetes bacterium]
MDAAFLALVWRPGRLQLVELPSTSADRPAGPAPLLPDAGNWDSVELPGTFNAWSVPVLPSGEPLLGGSCRTSDGDRSALLRLAPSGTQVIESAHARSPGWLCGCAAG